MTVFVCLRACFFIYALLGLKKVDTEILSSDPVCLIHLAKIRNKQWHYMEKNCLIYLLFHLFHVQIERFDRF